MSAPTASCDGVTYEDDRPRMHWLNPPMRRLQATLDRALPGKTNLILNRSRRRQPRADLVRRRPTIPGTYYVFDRAARAHGALLPPYDALVGQAFRAGPRRSAIRSRDGITIHGYLTLPPGRPSAACR